MYVKILIHQEQCASISLCSKIDKLKRPMTDRHPNAFGVRMNSSAKRRYRTVSGHPLIKSFVNFLLQLLELIKRLQKSISSLPFVHLLRKKCHLSLSQQYQPSNTSARYRALSPMNHSQAVTDPSLKDYGCLLIVICKNFSKRSLLQFPSHPCSSTAPSKQRCRHPHLFTESCYHVLTAPESEVILHLICNLRKYSNLSPPCNTHHTARWPSRQLSNAIVKTTDLGLNFMNHMVFTLTKMSVI